MRNCLRNQRDIWFANPAKYIPVLDEYGNDTLEVETLYSDRQFLRVNVSVNDGSQKSQTYGLMSDYARTLVLTGESCPIKENAKIWFNTLEDGPNNYVADKVLDSKNVFVVGLREAAK